MSGESSGLHFTIGSAAGHDSPNDLDLSEDLALVKATLLYADRVKLCSAGASILSGIAEFAEAPAEARAKTVVKFLPQLQPSMTTKEIYFFEAVVGLHGTRLKRSISKRTRKEVLGMVKKQDGQLREMVMEQHQAAGIEGFREAVRSGVLEIHPFRQTSAEGIIEAMIRGGGNLLYGIDLADLLEEYLDQARGALENSATYPLFDDITGDFVAEAIRAGLLPTSEASTARGRYGGISADLLRRLPMFETASLSDVLAIRRELEVPLRGFRLALADFSREIRSAGWEPGFPDEADALFREKVEPEVERIKHDVRENRSLSEFAWRTARHGVGPGVIGAVVGSLADLTELAGLAFGVGSGVVRALAEQREREREIRGNQLYFYYHAGKSLGG